MQVSTEQPTKGKKKQKKKRQNRTEQTPPRSMSVPTGKQPLPPLQPARPTIMQAKERAMADALFASSSSQWYAGAAFDRSPAANTLPRPTRLLTKSPTKEEGQNVMASSCPVSSILAERTSLTSPGTRTRMPTPPMDSNLRQKSRDLLNLLRSEPQAVTVQDKSKSEDLEEMTRQVRKLLNIS
ncbi:hypothetical protein PSACC_00443 [Paramicrosporidium saccamoebae]|uniref:Uncharacterized protein n=1 Tax=Paramicrosporidium saccamoebae TaxID=1246581 RepID=A0A2H9TPZ0_9FUNG|nr:hypothetical protein PSACC_00443 [Paramicrosporidium saccamoebae]